MPARMADYVEPRHSRHSGQTRLAPRTAHRSSYRHIGPAPEPHTPRQRRRRCARGHNRRLQQDPSNTSGAGIEALSLLLSPFAYIVLCRDLVVNGVCFRGKPEGTRAAAGQGLGLEEPSPPAQAPSAREGGLGRAQGTPWAVSAGVQPAAPRAVRLTATTRRPSCLSSRFAPSRSRGLRGSRPPQAKAWR